MLGVLLNMCKVGGGVEIALLTQRVSSESPVQRVVSTHT